MTEETRPGFQANYKIVRPGPVDTSIPNPAHSHRPTMGSHLLRSRNSSRSTTLNRCHTRTSRCQKWWSTRKTQLGSWLLRAEASSTETLDWCPIRTFRRAISFQSRVLLSVRCSIRNGLHNIRAGFQICFFDFQFSA